MRKLYVLCLLLALSFIIPKDTYATHALGGDLMYVQISPTEFEVTLRIYRDCNGIALNNTADIFWQGACGSGSVVADRISNIDITPLCPGLPTACQGGSGTIGIEEHIYTTVVTVPAGCTDITFDYTLCCRNHIITTLVDPGNENIYLTTSHLDVNNIINSSPVFNNYPAPIVCVNQPVVYNHGVYDPDGDSLYFSPTNCYEAMNDTVEYLPGYNGVTPLVTANPIQIHPNTGAITFTPTIQQVGVMCILVEEFRDGVKIGEVLRDIQFNVIACANVPPVASGINNQPGVDSLDFVISICENSQVCFDLSFTDSDNDNLTVSWNQEIPAATFQVFNNGTQTPTGQFCWQPQQSDVGLNFFSINITDDACPLVGSSTYTYTVEVEPNPNTMTIDYGDLVCTGGVAEISITPSSTPDSVYWAPDPTLTVVNDTFATVQPTFSQSYGVAVYFGASCILTDNATINISPDPAIVGTANTSNLCLGGTVTLNGSGGQSYTWDNGVVDGVPFTPPAGISEYVVEGVDSNGCTNTDTVEITVSPVVGIQMFPMTPLCPGDSISLRGFGAQSYSWNNGVIDGVAFVPPVGTTTYIMEGTDINGCTAVDSIDITVNPFPTLAITASDDSICLGDSLSLTASGASIYTWDNGMNNGDFISPSAGGHAYNVLGVDSNGCEANLDYEIFVHALPNVTITPSATALCLGDTLTLTANGAVNYVWSNGVTNGQSFVPSLGTDTFSVLGTDDYGCENNAEISITTNTLPPIVIDVAGNNLCEGESTSLSASGASNYNFSNGLGNGVSFVPPVGNTWYYVAGTDTNGCTAEDSVELIVNPNPIVSAVSSASVVCENESLVLTGNGATSYVWSNGVTDGVSFTPPVGTTDYIVTGTDANGCVGTDTTSITVNPLPTIQIAASDTEVCDGDMVSLTASGASTYVWSNGINNGDSFIPPVGTSTNTVIGTDGNGCENSDTVDILVNALPNVIANAIDNVICDGESATVYGSGAVSYVWDNGVSDNVSFVPAVGTTTYTVIGTDANGCESQDAVDILVNALPNISVTASSTEVCEGESVTLNGYGAQNYAWNNGVVDGQSFVPPVGLNNYVVTATDTNSCVQNDSIEVLVNALPNVVANTTSLEICDGDVITLNGSGASTYVWDNGVQDGVSFVPNINVTDYQVTGTDANGCVNTDNIQIQINALPNVVANAIDNVICDGESATVYGTGAVSYVWDNGVSDNVSFVPAVGTTTYTVIGTDANGCESQDAVDILVNALPNISVTASSTEVCEGESVTLNGYGAQNYAWNNGVVDGQSFVPPVGLNNYVVTATDTNSCVQNDSIEVLVNALPNVVANTTSLEICDGDAITLNGSGASTYVWDNGVQDGLSFAPNINVTDYQVTGTDANGCVNTDNIQIQINALPNVVANAIDNVICDGESATVYGSGAVSYVWDNGVSDNVSFVPAVGTTTYTVIGTDANGCESQDAVDILVNALPNISVTASSTEVCEGESVTLNGYGAQYYAWNNGVVDGQSFVPPVGLNSYVVTATDTNSCVQNDSIEVLVSALPNVVANASNQQVCTGTPVSLTGSGAQTYTWNNNVNDGISFIPDPSISTYTVTGTDVNGCVNTASIVLTVYALPNVQANATSNELCDGAELILTGSGAQTYLWDNGVVDGQSFTPGFGNTTFIVTGTDGNGCVANDTINITLNPLPIPGINSTSNEVCANESVTLYGSGGQNYIWNNGVLDGVAFVPPVGTTEYIVCVIDTNNCQSHDTVSVVSHPLPQLSIVSSAMAICDGQAVTLDGSGAPVLSWSNSLQNGQAFIPPLGQSTYILTGIDQNTCTNTESITLTVNPNPTIQITSSPNIICEGNLVTLNASGASTYQWSNGITNNLPFMPNPGLNVYSVVATDSNGCQSTTDAQVMVNPLPTVHANASDNNVCEGTDVTLIGSGAQSYVWNNNVVEGQAFTPPVGTTTYSVIGTNSFGCQDEANISITVYPTPDVLAISNNQRVCEGTPVMLTASGAQNYTWSNGIANGDTIIPPLGNNIFQVIGEDANGCVAQDTILIEVLQNGLLSEMPDEVVCDINNHVLTTSSTYIQSYQWGIVVNQTGYDLSETYTYQGTTTDELTIVEIGAGVHTFYVQMEGLCGNHLSDTVLLTIHESTPIDILNDTTLCMHENNNIFADVQGNNIIWNDGTQGQYLVPTVSGMYTVSFEEPNTGCIVSDTMFVEMEDCIDNCIVVLPSGFSPNYDGVNDIFRTIDNCDEGFSYYNLVIYDRWGNLVFVSEDPTDGWDGLRQGNKCELGVYAYHLTYSKEMSNKTEQLKGNVTLIH